MVFHPLASRHSGKPNLFALWSVLNCEEPLAASYVYVSWCPGVLFSCFPVVPAIRSIKLKRLLMCKPREPQTRPGRVQTKFKPLFINLTMSWLSRRPGHFFQLVRQQAVPLFNILNILAKRHNQLCQSAWTFNSVHMKLTYS